MEYLYLFIVVVLITLAISDLVVGVSNDAVNFVNSAIGSKAASFRVVMIIAALGVLVGATFSSGMMEVARKGIFNPDQFMFNEIMIIFLAVMITDVILLDLFNTAGLPTSTTVSLIFELLGASMAVSAMKIIQQGGAIQELAQYINSGKVVAIITGILISIAIAFTIGALVQYLVRVIFTFRFQSQLRYFGSIWGGLAITVMVFFLFIKGAKGASFLSPDLVAWFHSNTWLILGMTFVVMTIILQLLYWIFRIDILKMIVLAGTFSLAMAFAGNDLVNFIGVPLAGLESFQAWRAAGGSAGSLSMGLLNNPVSTPTLYLLLAGLVMVVTLFLSKKARKVTKTEVNLSKQDEGEEMFESTRVSRGIVNVFLLLNDSYQKLIPGKARMWLDRRFKQPRRKQWKNENLPAFDMLRASVNLVVSSMLIALGTSLKLPLSTTYVTFMVAMGTSLSDRAWGRETAVYRVNGVITVVGGWFFTAFSAFTAAFLFATGIFFGEIYAILGLIALALYFAYRTNVYHRMKIKEEAQAEQLATPDQVEYATILDVSEKYLRNSLPQTGELYQCILGAFVQDDRKKIFRQEKKIKELIKLNKLTRKQLHLTLKTYEAENTDAGVYYLNSHQIFRELTDTLNKIYRQVFDYMINRHHPPSALTGQILTEVVESMAECIRISSDIIANRDYTRKTKYDEAVARLNHWVGELKSGQIRWLKENDSGSRLSLLLMDAMQETTRMSIILHRLIDLHQEFNTLYSSGDASATTPHK